MHFIVHLIDDPASSQVQVSTGGLLTSNNWKEPVLDADIVTLKCSHHIFASILLLLLILTSYLCCPSNFGQPEPKCQTECLSPSVNHFKELNVKIFDLIF